GRVVRFGGPCASAGAAGRLHGRRRRRAVLLRAAIAAIAAALTAAAVATVVVAARSVRSAEAAAAAAATGARAHDRAHRAEVAVVEGLAHLREVGAAAE